MFDVEKKIIKSIINYYKIIVLKKQKIFIEKNVSMSRAKFSKFNRICQNSDVNDSSFDAYSYVGKSSVLNNVEVGAYTSIGPHVKVVYGTHPINFVSFCPVFYSTRKQCGVSFVDEQLFEEFRFVKSTQKSAVIGNDVWIGSDVKIIEGVTIHDGSVVLAGAIVTKDVEEYSVVGGVPAKHIKYRFNLEQRELLNKFKWWNQDENWIKDNARLFSNVEAFTRYIRNNLSPKEIK